MFIVNLATAIALLEGVVAKFGADHRPVSSGLGTCIYFDENMETGALTAVCLVGQGFAELGILRATHRGYAGSNVLDTDRGTENNFAACHLNSPMWERAEAMGVTFTPKAREFMKDAQNHQDNGAQWGDAVSDAKDKALTTERLLIEEAVRAAEDASEVKGLL